MVGRYLRSPVVRHSAWNLAGVGTPFLIALVTVPILLRDLGEERFGVLTLAWSMIGYFSVLDLGLSRALTRVVARKAGDASPEEASVAAWSALIAIGALGVFSGLLLALLSSWLVNSVLTITPALRRETVAAFRIVALGVPVTVFSTGLRGILEGRHRFGATNVVRFFLGAFTFAGPLTVLPFSHTLPPVIAVLVLGRSIACGANFLLCRTTPELASAPSFSRRAVSSMLHFGGWVTVSNVLGPAISTTERFLIGGTASVVALTYYQTPNEVISRVGIVPWAIAAAMFPSLSAGFGADLERAGELVLRATKWLLMILAPAALLGLLFADRGLALWLGADFARHAAPVVHWLIVAHLMGCLLQVPNTLLHAAGRPDLYAKLLFVEIPIYLPLFYWNVAHFGIAGAAATAAGRVALDLAFLLYQNVRLIPETRRIVPRVAVHVAAVLAVLAVMEM